MTRHHTPLAEQIVDTAIELAEQSSWEKLCLHHIAQALDISLAEIHRHYSVKDELVEAWYDRADRAMLQTAAQTGFASLSYRTRLHTLIMAWLDFLATHKAVSRDMLWYKLEPAHIHLQIQGLLRVSRTVQWLREAAGMDSTHLQRIAEEIGLTSIYLRTFARWMLDSSTQQVMTRTFLDTQLARAERIATYWFHRRPSSPATQESATHSNTPG